MLKGALRIPEAQFIHRAILGAVILIAVILIAVIPNVVILSVAKDLRCHRAVQISRKP